MKIIELSDKEVGEAIEHVRGAVLEYHSVEDEAFLRSAAVLAQGLPERLRMELNEFRLTERDGACVIRGFHIDDGKIGPTPSHWRERDPGSTREEDTYFFLCCSLLGDPIGWATQQDGRVLHDVHPIREHETEQLGSGSSEELTWHTEDAFHPFRPDYLGLFCLRNPDSVETTWSAVSSLDLPPEYVESLCDEKFPIRPDRSHLPKNMGGTAVLGADEQELLAKAYDWIVARDKHPEEIAVFFGGKNDPYLRIDPYFMEVETLDEKHWRAFEAVTRAIDSQISGYAAKPGEILIFDNYRTVHGRRPFKARYDGRDRWLKRLNIVRDLRKSRSRRISAESRAVY
jgi:Fe(II)/alpha-ketoglutarate-dependent arginine beta-hydroxylase